MKPGFKRTCNWNKYLSKIATQGPNKYLDSIVDPIFQGVNKMFVSSFEIMHTETLLSNYKN